MGPKINSEGRDRLAFVSSDGKYLFFNSSRVTELNKKPLSGGPGNAFWVDAKIIEELNLENQNKG